MHITRLLAHPLLLLTAILSMLFAPDPASAGVATIYQCRTPSGSADTDLLRTSGDQAVSISLVACATTSTYMVSTAPAGVAFPRVTRSLTFTAPGSTRFVGGTLRRQMKNYIYMDIDNGGGDSWAFGYALTNAENEILERCGFNSGQQTLGPYCAPAFAGIYPGSYTEFPTSSRAL